MYKMGVTKTQNGQNSLVGYFISWLTFFSYTLVIIKVSLEFHQFDNHNQTFLVFNIVITSVFFLFKSCFHLINNNGLLEHFCFNLICVY